MSLIPGYVPFEYDGFTARGPLRKEDLPAIRKTYRRFAAMRAEVLERALEVEYDLVKVIVHGLHGRDYPRHRLLRALVFDTPSCTFMDKRRMLSQLFNLFPERFVHLDTEKGKALRRDLNEIILTRDLFAHGQLCIDGGSQQAVMQIYRDGIQDVIIDEATLTVFADRCLSVLSVLRELVGLLADKPFDGLPAR